MATKKSAATVKKRTTAKKPATRAAKTTTKVTTVRSAAAPVRATNVQRTERTDSILNLSLLNLVVAEVVGTFILTLVALATAQMVVPLFVGLTLVVLVLVIGTASGSHVNPAVTFGLWAARKVKSALVPFYWLAQMLGAFLAVVVLNGVAGKAPAFAFDHFGTFSWPIFWLELVGTAVFLFGLTAVVKRQQLSNTARALGIGLSLFVAIVVSGTLYNNIRTVAIKNYQDSMQHNPSKEPEIPHEIYVSGATLNPAVALAATETTKAELQSSQTGGATEDKRYSRISWEVILATLVGAALGSNLALLVGHRFEED
jgi:aquaporin Z